MQEKTEYYYQKKAQDVLQYIQNNLNADLSLKVLSDYSGISSFHFHRIMRAFLNEPLGSYIDRKRLETAITLLRYSNETLNEIASKIGYSNNSAFSKAFTKEFGVSPQAFKQNPNISLNTHIDFRINGSSELKTDVKPKYIVLPDKQVACITIKGIYGGESTSKAWDELSNFVVKNKLTGWNPEVYAVYYDNPYSMAPEDCMSDICFAIKKDIEPQGRIYQKTFTGGRYAVFRYKGPYERLWELYLLIYKNWLLFSDFRLRDLPSVQKYLNVADNKVTENPITEIYIPVDFE
jgi:AraC family transcriptional regulator